MDIRAIDLNLLPMLDALLRHRAVSIAARELDMSQSALSSALARLRILLGDPLFVRTGRGLMPTPRASALAEPLGEILNGVRERVVLGGTFDPRKDRRTFRLLMTGVGAYVLWPRILQAVRDSATPSVQLQLRVVAPTDIAAELAEGGGDLAIGAFPHLPKSLFQRRLFERHYVCLMHRDHPLARKLTVREFARAPHVVVRMASGIQGHIDEELERLGHERTDVIELPSYLMAPPLLGAGRFVCVLPGQLADEFERHSELVSLPAPVTIPVSIIRMYWHQRLNQDKGNAWLRQLIFTEWSDAHAD